MELDFHSQDVNKRFCKINASKKNLIWNIQKRKLTLINKKSRNKKIFLDKGNMYFNQMKYFVKKKFNPLSSRKEMQHSLKILRLIKKIKLNNIAKR